MVEGRVSKQPSILRKKTIEEEEKMKQKKEKKLRLVKTTLNDLAPTLDRDEQIRIKGGFDKEFVGVTILPVYC
jgi:hypothetical protein